MKFKLYISILLLFGFGFSNLINASENVYTVLDNNSYVFEYTAAYSEKSEVNNFFIKEIAKYNLSSLYNTKFTYHYSISKTIVKKSPYTYEVEVLLEGEKCTGNVFYKNFDISDILMPEFADLTLIVENNGNYIQSREFVEIHSQDKQSFKLSFEFDTPEGKKDFDLKVSEIGFYSDELDKDIFYDRITQIDDYYAGIAAIENSISRFEKVNFSPTSIPRSYLQLNEFERIYELISNSDFIDKLHIDSDKQKEFFEKINEFDSKYQFYLSQYSNRLKTLDYLFMSDDFTSLAENYVDEVNHFCLLSNEATHSQQGYFYKLGMMEYSDLDKEEFEDGFIDVLTRTKYNKDIETVLSLFYNKILEVYIQNSDELIASNEYNLARGLLINAQNFSQTFINKEPPLELSIQLSKANYGIYNSYLHLIDRAIEIGNYELADNYIQKAQVFQEENSSSIISNQSIRNVSVELVKLYISKGYKQIKNEEFFEANYCFEQAQSKCLKIEIYNHDYVIKHGLIESRNGLYNLYVYEAQRALLNNDYDMARKYLDDAQDLVKSYPSQIVELKEFYELKSKLMQQAYNNHIYSGEKYYANGDFIQAYIQLLAAVQMENSPDIETNETVAGLFRTVAAEYLIEQCRLGDVKVKKNQLDEAKTIYDNCITLQIKYGLYDNMELMEGMTLLNSDIFNEYCNNIKIDFNNQLSEIENLVSSGAYIPAQIVLKEAEELSQANSSCVSSQATLKGYMEFVPYAAEYQKLANEAQKALENNDSPQLLELFQEMEVLSSEHEYIRKWIEAKPLFYLFAVKKNLAFLETSIDSYDNEQEYEIAMRMVDVLESGAATVRESKSIQVQLGQKLALADKNDNSNNDPSQKVEKYTNGNSYYKYFKKAYLESWNN